MKTFKKYSSARRAANGRPILRIDGPRNQELCIVFDEGDLIDISLTDVSIVETVSGRCTGGVILKHLDRLGNANHALANPNWHYDISAFPEEPEL